LFGYHRMPSTTTPTAMRLSTGGTTCSATAECRTDNAHRAAAPHRRCRLSWLPPDAEHHNACRAAAPHWRCRLLGYSQTPNGTTPFGLRPPLKPHNHPCKSEFVTWGGVYHGRRREVKIFFTSCIVPHLVGRPCCAGSGGQSGGRSYRRPSRSCCRSRASSQVIEILVIVGGVPLG